MLLNMIAEAVFMSMMVSLVSAKQMNRIINGKNATQGQFPYQVSWQKCKHIIADFSSKCFNFCGGSIFNENTIITAAHCCDSIGKPNKNNNIYYWSDTKIIAGDSNLADESGLEQVRKIKSHTIHPHYTRIPIQNDMCLLTLESPLKFDKYVGHISLDNQKPKVGNKCQVSGWGYQVVGLVFKVFQIKNI